MQLDGVSKVINNIASSIEGEEKDKFLDKKKEILLKCKQRQIEILDIHINKEKTGRYIIKVYIYMK